MHTSFHTQVRTTLYALMLMGIIFSMPGGSGLSRARAGGTGDAPPISGRLEDQRRTLSTSDPTYLPLVVQNNFPPGCNTKPTLIQPADVSSLSTLVLLFQWDSGDNPSTAYLLLQVALDPTFTQEVIAFYDYDTQAPGQFRFSSNLTPATTYYWHAILNCAGTNQALFSNIRTFTTGSGGTIPPASSLIAPANGSTLSTTSATIQWSAVSGAVEYLVGLKEPGASSYGWTTTTNTQYLITNLNASHTYEWWIAARNDYAWGADSVHWTFTTGAALAPSPGSGHAIYLVDKDGRVRIVTGK